MRVELLLADVEQGSVGPDAAVARSLAAIGRRPTYQRPLERPGTADALAELVHLYAEAAAGMRLLEFAFSTDVQEFDTSRARFYAVDRIAARHQQEIIPVLRARLREVRQREAQLEEALAERGIDGSSIGPLVPAGQAIDASPKPGEAGYPRPRLTVPPRPRTLGDRLRRLSGAFRRRSGG